MVDFSQIWPGDIVRVKENGITGTIVNVHMHFDDSTATIDISVDLRWDHSPDATWTYPANEVKDIWEKVDSINYLPLPEGTHLIGKMCKHKWIDVGFSKEKLVCAYCDTDKI